MNRITPKFSRLADYAEYVIFSPIFMLNYKKKIKEQNKNYVIVPVYSIHPSRKQKTINQKYSLRVLRISPKYSRLADLQIMRYFRIFEIS